MAAPTAGSGQTPKPKAKPRGRPRDWAAKVGELAVYPGHGVARIEAVQSKDIGGGTQEFLVLCKLEDDSRILIPKDRVGEVGLRPVMKRKQAGEIWELLKQPGNGARRQGVPWSRQFREYQEKLRDGTIFDTAEVLRDLMLLQQNKELSFGERKLLESARSLLVQELAAAEDSLPEKIEADIRAAVK